MFFLNVLQEILLVEKNQPMSTLKTNIKNILNFL